METETKKNVHPAAELIKNIRQLRSDINNRRIPDSDERMGAIREVFRLEAALDNCTVKLQGVGRVEAKPAGAFKVGESMMWNTGATSKVIEILEEKSTDKFINFKVECADLYGNWANSQIYERRLKKTRLVAIG